MTGLEAWVQTPAAKALGWTLVHSVWEGAVLALGLAAALSVVRSSRARYAAACLALLGMLAAFCLTFALLMPQHAIRRVTTLEAHGIPLGSEQWLVAKKTTQRSASDFPAWLAPLWIAGVLAFQLWTLSSWIAVQRLRRTGVCRATEIWQRRLTRLGAIVRLPGRVTLFESCLADVPVVIGYVRPVILMPVGLLTGLPVGQIESILLHELAHIQRHDYLVNLLQTSVEGLLFYHPGVWWMSSVIRAEREDCCDDLVVTTQGDALEYALALATLEYSRSARREAALAATGGNLLKRIRRLLNQPERPGAALTPGFSAAILTITLALALAAWQKKPAGDPPNLAAPVAPVVQAAPAAKIPLRQLAQVRVGPVGGPSSSPYDKWLDQDVAYIISDQERAAFKRLEADEERVQFIKQFWMRRDPTPGTPENEVKEEHYRRIAYSNERYGTIDLPGWKTDRGRLYITWGPPDEIESHPSGGAYNRPAEQGGGVTSTFPFEQWRYRHIEGVGNDVSIEFVDKSRSGAFRMTTDPYEKDTAPYSPGQSGGRVFSSTAPGTQITVEITPNRRMLVSIPIDFDAKQYSITGAIHASDGGNPLGEFTAVLSLCRNSSGEFGCLERQVFQPSPAVIGGNPLEPGSYVFDAVVKDRAGLIQKTYTVSFYVD
jgi:GWxTD domain-containing protein